MIPTMRLIDHVESSNIAVIGGGQRCKALLESLLRDDPDETRTTILGVADINDQAAGMMYARENGIYTTNDFKELLSLPELNVVIELTGDDGLRAGIQDSKPPWVFMVDHDEAQPLLDFFRIRGKKTELVKRLHANQFAGEEFSELLEEFYEFVQDINQHRNRTFRDIQARLADNDWIMSQIIQGSTIPTFVIDKHHRITHWNQACETLTGYPARAMVGTDDQWKPFRAEKRPTMADLILDGVSEEELWQHYGTAWDKSALIEAAYEAEEYFPHMGDNGKWVFFTAAPITAPDGSISGAIETLWDKTKEKEAEAERERQNEALALKVNESIANEQALSHIIQGSTIPTFVIDKDHRVTHWNTALEKLTGVPARDIVGTRHQWQPFYEKERPSMADVIVDQIDELAIRKLYGGKWRKSALVEGAYEAEVFFPKLGNGGRWCWFTAAPIKTPEGQVVGAIETIWDKTEDKNAEKERERHTQELATFCSIYATLSGPLSIEGRVKDAIEEAATIFRADGICIFLRNGDGTYHLQYSTGYSETLCYENRIADTRSMTAHAAQSGRIQTFSDLPDAVDDEMRLLQQEGMRSLVYIPLVDKEERAFGVIRVASKTADHFDANDIRALELIGNRIGVAIENALLQEDIRQKADFQGKLIGSSNDGIVATDSEWRIITFNPAAERIFGHAAAEVIGKMDARDLYPHELNDKFSEMLGGFGNDWNLPWQEASVLSKTGESIPVRCSGTLLHEKKHMMGAVAFFHDLREIKRLEKELLSAERLAAIGQTVAGMAHCVKNILHGLKGGSYMVNIGIDKDDAEKLKNGWQMVQRNIGRTSDLVLDLLSYSKEREPEYQPCSPNEIADDVCELMNERARESGIELVKDFSSQIEEMSMDGRTLHRCLLNLVSNAIDACAEDDTPGKQHRVAVTTLPEENNVIRFEVKDNGAGMSDDVKRKLFSSFFSTKGPKGTGLGLLVTRKLIEEHNGTIDVTSQEGRGTTFTVRLPFTDDNPK